MSDERTITVANCSDGPVSHGDPGTSVSLPVVELLTGRGFVTGKSGSGKSNTASVVAEKLLDNGFGMLIVDIDGEYYGLKEEYEILHAGGDDECDIQVTPDHAEKLATLALEQNVPIILDVSSFLDESEARELLTAVAKQLFVKAKKLKQPFLLLVEEIHEYIPEQGGLDECGRMLIKIGKRGRKHGLGIVGISQRPADVKKDYITQCDWLVWHRLTWNNDTKVVGRILDNEYADAVEDLDDGEAFMMTDWSEAVRRVQFHRKQTFDAGATPGLDDFERPDLKSVSDDLVSDLQEISDEKREQENTIAELRERLNEKNDRIAELEKELQDARDLRRMAEQFVEAMVDEVDGANPGRTELDRMRARRQRREGVHRREDDAREVASHGVQHGGSDPDPQDGATAYDPHAAGGDGDDAESSRAAAPSADGSASPASDRPSTADSGTDDAATAGAASAGSNDEGDASPEVDAAAAFGAFEAAGGADSSAGPDDGAAESDDDAAAAADENRDDAADTTGASDDDVAAAFGALGDGADPADLGIDAEALEDAFDTGSDDGDDAADTAAADDVAATDEAAAATADADAQAAAAAFAGGGSSAYRDEAATNGDGSADDTPEDENDAPVAADDDWTFGGVGEDETTPSFESFEDPGDAPTIGDAEIPATEDVATMDASEFGFEADTGDDPPTVADIAGRESAEASRPEPPSVGDLRARIRNLDEQTRRMLAYYHEQGPASPLDTHFVAGGTGDRTDAYAHNRKLRQAGLIEHVGQGAYDTALDARLREATDDGLEEADHRAFLDRLTDMLET